MTETRLKENPAQQPLRAAKNLRELIQPAIAGMLIDRFFRGDAESYFLFLEILDSAQTWTEAVELIDEEAIRREIHPSTLPAMKLKRLIKRKFGV
ncbi:hypothetical protein L0337_11735 [candidate division KSB1 bacterium]|nr:hypothetical protein [candidate division KSB1 bacterium]